MYEFHDRGHQLMMSAGMMFVCGLDDGNVSLSDPESAGAWWVETCWLPGPGVVTCCSRPIEHERDY